MKITKGQKWKSNDTGVILILVQKADGNKHWKAVSEKGKTHKIHEGTLEKYYSIQA